MTESMSAIENEHISPFILPYILAAQREKAVGNSTVFQSPSASSSISPRSMYSPISPKSPKSPQRLSPQRESPKKAAPTTPSPQRRDSSLSPNMLHRSVIEQSVHELQFDPELTFIASPKSSSPSPATRHRGLPTSRMLVDSPVKPVSPNRSVVPLDETEIGFSDELRASLQVSNSLSTLIEEEPESSSRSKRQKTNSALAVPAPEPGPRVRKIKKPVVEETTPILPPSKEDKKPVHAVSGTKSGKRKEPEKDEETPAVSSREPLTRSSRKKAVEEPKPVEPVTRSTRKKQVEEEPKPVEKSSKKPDEEVQPVEPVTRSTRKRQQPPSPTKEAAQPEKTIPLISRKSPRFASKVIPATSGADDLSCPRCAKAYKRKDLYEKHVKSCSL